ncbi:MAG: flagellar hook-basal body complex protein [Aliarcobacter sp.]|nr:flagellar hook-basal body complex protein [Aliarcobacter sp.]
MIGALWNGISGLNTFEKAINVESNNATNVTTVGYKEDVISFEDMMYQNGYGKGSNIQTVTKAMSQQGGIKLTSSPYDVAIEGEGYFIIGDKLSNNEYKTYYTRAGNFKKAESGLLQTQSNMNVLGLSSVIDKIDGTNTSSTQFNSRYSNYIASQNMGNNTYLQTINAKATDYVSSVKDDLIDTTSGNGYKTKSSKINDIDLLIGDYKNKLKLYADYKTFSINLSDVKLGDELKATVNDKEITQSFVPPSELATQEQIDAFISTQKNAFAQKVASASGENVNLTSTGSELILSSTNRSTSLENALLNNSALKISNTTDAVVSSSSQITNVTFPRDSINIGDNISLMIDGNIVRQSFSTNTEFKNDIEKNAFIDNSLKEFSDKISNIKGLTSSIDSSTGVLRIESLVPGNEIKIVDAYLNNDLAIINTTEATLGFGISMVNSSKEALKDALERANADFLEITNKITLTGQNDLSNVGEIQLSLANKSIVNDTIGEMVIEDGIVYVKDGDNKFLVGKVQTAGFTNEQGLSPAGGNLYQVSADTGNVFYAGELNKLVSSSLEESKANLGNSLTALLIYQKAFEANSKSITTSDDLLQTAIQLKK